MAERKKRNGSGGFSLVEMLVALVFVMILMAGLAAVFRGTLSLFTASGENLSSLRRNRMSLDLLYDDLNAAGMYLTDLTTPPTVYSTNEAFYVRPDYMASQGTPIAGVTQGADELYFLLDEAMPFEGTLFSTPAESAAKKVESGLALTADDYNYVVECRDANYAKMVKVGQYFIFKDSWNPSYITSVTQNGTRVSVGLGADPDATMSGRGAAGLPSNFKHIASSTSTSGFGTGIVFVNPNQMVRYSLRLLSLDPASTSATTVCLVRDQGTYTASGFTATAGSQQVVTENVSGFRVYLSANAGASWVGGTGFADWAAIKAGLDTQLGASGRPGFTSLGTDLNWFRSIPLLVRVDVTTRTAKARTEYSATGKTLAFKEQVQSMVMVPRHFGLTMN